MNLERGSLISAEIALRRLGKACELLAMDPTEMVNRARENLTRF